MLIRDFSKTWEEGSADTHLLQDLIRISVGTEHIDDIIADFEQSFKAASAATTEGKEGKPQDKEQEAAPTVV